MSPTLIFKSFTELGIPEIYTILFIIVIYYLIIKKNLENNIMRSQSTNLEIWFQKIQSSH